MLDAKAAVQLALVLHELATNARKYGALRQPAGKVGISWNVEDGPDRGLVMRWTETGMSGVKKPAREGFGSSLIERSLQSAGGKATVDYLPTGLTCLIKLPIGDGCRRRHGERKKTI